MYDSDDCLAENAIEKIYAKWEKVSRKGYAGIIGLDADFKGKVIGKGFSQGNGRNNIGGVLCFRGVRDKKLIYRTDVIKEYPPYPTFTGEKYVSISIQVSAD